MKTPHGLTRKAPRGFTLIELLVVISIIAVLAGMILPVLGIVKTKARITQAKVEMSGLMTAITQYEADYNRYPASQMTRASVNDAEYPDFTFGTWYRPKTDAGYRLVGKKGPCPVIETRRGGNLNSPGSPLETSNAEVMSALCDLERFNNLEETLNYQHVLNPKKTRYLVVKEVNSPAGRGSLGAPGLGTDGVFRDPWGNPYIISVDLNYDGRCRDGLYRYASVSADASGKGLNGLSRPAGVNAGDYFEANKPIMVWSFGPDGYATPAARANANDPANPKIGNKDNIISWQ